jgi:hypothetical protein
MRKLAFIGVLAAALAFDARADDTQEKKQEAQQELHEKQGEAKQEASKAKAEAQEDAAKAQAKANEKMGEARQEAAEETREAEQQGTASGRDPSADPGRAAASGDMGRTSMGTDDRKHPLFTKDNFDVKGTIQSASASSITIRREDLPAVKLHVDQNTKVELDGDRASATQLQPGQEVKASFNLQSDKPMAVEIKADKKK